MPLSDNSRCRIYAAFVDYVGEEATLEFLSCYPRNGSGLGPLSDRSRYKLYTGLLRWLGEDDALAFVSCFPRPEAAAA